MLFCSFVQYYRIQERDITRLVFTASAIVFICNIVLPTSSSGSSCDSDSLFGFLTSKLCRPFTISFENARLLHFFGTPNKSKCLKLFISHCFSFLFHSLLIPHNSFVSLGIWHFKNTITSNIVTYSSLALIYSFHVYSFRFPSLSNPCLAFSILTNTEIIMNPSLFMSIFHEWLHKSSKKMVCQIPPRPKSFLFSHF